MCGPKTKGKRMERKCKRYKNEMRKEKNKEKKIIKEAKRQERFDKYRAKRLAKKEG
jgi:uncharacterized protein YktA (UPF0223 family)